MNLSNRLGWQVLEFKAKYTFFISVFISAPVDENRERPRVVFDVFSYFFLLLSNAVRRVQSRVENLRISFAKNKKYRGVAKFPPWSFLADNTG